MKNAVLNSPKLKEKVVTRGRQGCTHSHIEYRNNPMDEQEWRCDDCGRYVKSSFSPGHPMKLPPSALIRTPNKHNGGNNTYSYTTDENGVAYALPKNEWVKKDGLETKMENL